MTSIKYKKGGDFRVTIEKAVNGTQFDIPAGCKVKSIITKKIGTVAGNLSIGADAVYEIASLTITKGVESDYEVQSFTIDGGIPAPVYEIQSFSVTGACTGDGDMTVDGETVAVTNGMTTAQVAEAIRGHSFTNWTTSGADSGVILTAKTYGNKADVVIDPNTGVTGVTVSAVSEDTAGVPDLAGNITVDGETVALDSEESTDDVATKIRAHSFTNWITSGTGSNVILTAKTYGDKALVVLDFGSTGVTASGGVSEDTAGTDLAGDVTITLNGAGTNVTLTNDDNTVEEVATKIAAESYTGWTVEQDGATITFTSTSYGNKTDAEFSGGSTGVTGSMTTPTQGVAGGEVVSSIALGGVDGVIADQTIVTKVQSMTLDYTGTINIDSEAKCDVCVVIQVLN